MNIGSVSGGAAAAGAVAGAPATVAGGPIPPLGFVSERLGMSLDAMRGALASGASIDELARGRGIAPETLRRTVAAHVEETRTRDGQPPIQPAMLSRILDRAFSQQRGGRPAAPATTPYSAPDESESPSAGGAVSIYA